MQPEEPQKEALTQGRFYNSGKNLEIEIHSMDKRGRGKVWRKEHDVGETSAQGDLHGAANNINSDTNNKHHLLSI